MFCGKCGAQVEDGVQFCGSCGALAGDQGNPQSESEDSLHLAVPTAQKSNKKLIGLIASATVVILIVGVVVLSGIKVFRAKSDSMAPKFRSGSFVVIKPIDPADIRIENIIVFTAGEMRSEIMHRVVDIMYDEGSDTYSFVTRGDANNSNDPSPVPEANVVGVVLFP